jgi:hypothetical protein
MRYATGAVDPAIVQTTHIFRNDAAEMEAAVNAEITRIAALGPVAYLLGMYLSGAGSAAKRRRDGNFVATIEYALDSPAGAIDSSDTLVFCFGGRQSQMDARRAAAQTRLADDSRNLMDTLMAGSGSVRWIGGPRADRFMGILVGETNPQ